MDVIVYQLSLGAAGVILNSWNLATLIVNSIEVLKHDIFFLDDTF